MCVYQSSRYTLYVQFYLSVTRQESRPLTLLTHHKRPGHPRSHYPYVVFDFQQLQKTFKRQKTQFEETERALEPGSDVAGMLDFSDQEFKVTVIDMLRALMEKGDSVQENTGSVSVDTEILRKNKKVYGQSEKGGQHV